MMTIHLTPNTQVTRIDTEETGHLLGPFVRKGEKWWTIFWDSGETTAQREAEILNGQEA
jgi:hypothetical protein